MRFVEISLVRYEISLMVGQFISESQTANNTPPDKTCSAGFRRPPGRQPRFFSAALSSCRQRAPSPSPRPGRGVACVKNTFVMQVLFNEARSYFVSLFLWRRGCWRTGGIFFEAGRDVVSSTAWLIGSVSLVYGSSSEA